MHEGGIAAFGGNAGGDTGVGGIVELRDLPLVVPGEGYVPVECHVGAGDFVGPGEEAV